jgi:hypothetical protein
MQTVSDTNNSPPGSRVLADWGALFFLLGCYLVGVVFWIFIFANPKGPGLAQCVGGDWALSHNYHAVLRDAFSQGKMPWLMTFQHYSDRFFGLPETPLSPQVLLVTVLSNPVYNLINVLLLYTVFFGGLVWMKREFKLSTIPFLFLFLMAGFNGYWVARVGVGQTMWYGYFFFPHFFVLLLRLHRHPGCRRTEILLAATFFAMLLQGGFHPSVWCILYLGFYAALRPSAAPSVARALAWAGGLCAFRVLPAVVSLTETELTFVMGYPGLRHLWMALTEAHGVGWKVTGHGWNWWEMDCYLGTAALLLLGFFAGLRIRRQPAQKNGYILDLVNILMLLLCMGSVMGALGKLPIPLFTSQRVAARIIILPLFGWIVLATLRMEAYLRAWRRHPGLQALLLLMLLFAAFDLYQHGTLWKVAYVDDYFSQGLIFPIDGRLVSQPDLSSPEMRVYVASVWGGLILSSITAIAAAFRYRRAYRSMR